MADADLLAGATQELLVERPAPPSRQPRSVLFLAGSLIGANAVSLGLRFVSGWLQLFLVKDPEVLGTFKLFGIALGYVPFFQGGVFHGLNRELPYYVGKGDRRRVEELAASAQAWALALSAIAALVFLALAGWNLLRGQLWPATGWATCAACSFTLFYNTSYLQATFRTGHDFTRLALVNVVQSTLTVALLVLVYLWSFYGLCLRLMIADLVAMGLLYYWRPVRVGPKLDLGCLKHLLVIGAPIFVAAQLYGYWATTLDSQFVVSFFGRKGLGDYYPATQVCQSFEFLPLAIMQVIYPRMAEQFGRTGSLKDLIPMTVKPTLALAALMIPLAVAGWWLLPPIVTRFAHNYVAGTRATQWALLPPLVLAFTPVNQIFMVAKRQGLYALAILLGMGTYTGAMWWLVHHGHGLAAFPQAMLVGRIVFILACYALIYYLVRRDSARTAAC
ncbi:MAG: lipopolysaccharide biosynthesis protein [Thermoguttaceae bacterium]